MFPPVNVLRLTGMTLLIFCQLTVNSDVPISQNSELCKLQYNGHVDRYVALLKNLQRKNAWQNVTGTCEIVNVYT